MEDLPRPRPRCLLQLRKALQYPGDIATTHRVLRHLLSAVWRQRRDQPCRSTQFQRDEYRGKIRTDSFGASGRSAAVCMVVSRVGGRNLTLPERRSLSTSPWDLDRVRRRQGSQEVTEIVSKRMKLKTNRVGGERAA